MTTRPDPSAAAAATTPLQDSARFLARLAHEPAVLVQVHSTQGSVPREAGAWMAVFADGFIGTIGGGNLEYEALAEARVRLRADAQARRAADDATVRVPLGPSLGQCCGGVVFLQFRLVGAPDGPRLRDELASARWPVALFGGGHVGHALAGVLCRLPVDLRWIDSRDGVFPQTVPAGVTCEHSEPVQAAVRDLPAGARVIIMSFSHAEDLDIVAACLQRQRSAGDLPFIGLIGSQTKWATFRHRLEARGFTPAELARVTCPIGVPGIRGKEPDVIAVAVAAQLLQSVYAG
ncbi:MAG: xanthine dehydrogenase accessory protein XdhC [Polaromonas sp.]|nr:xanthine dehydrogenase accessory protein XdhC [Polaromonas sp.]